MITDHDTKDGGPEGPELRIEFPLTLHSLGLDLDDAEREAHLREVAAEVWCGGTQAQRDAVRGWYAEVAEAAAADGAFYAGLGIFATPDDRMSTVTLVARLDTTDRTDARTATDALHEVLSLTSAHDVHPVELECGPAVVSFSAVEYRAGADEHGARPDPVEIARAEVYVPLPELEGLLVLGLATPSLLDLPDYVRMLSHVAETVEVFHPEPSNAADNIPTQIRIPSPAAANTTPTRIRRAFG